MPNKFPIYLGLFILILCFVFRSIILNISTNLLDWLDYPYIIWTIFQSVTHIKNLDLVNFFETNAFYPHRLTLLFSDILLPQSLILLSFLSITKSLILSFNLTFLITFILDFIAGFLLWRQIFKKELIAFFGSLFIVFSPFFHLELSHFQMMSYWPFLFALYFLFKYEEKKHRKNLIFVGLFLTIQFLASVYLSIFLIFTIFIFYISRIVIHSQIRSNIFRISLIFIVFLITSGLFIQGYIDMKNTYQIKRNINEYINYSANLSDYIFTSQIKSLIHQSELLKTWNNSNKNHGSHSSFPGFLISILGIYSLFKILKNKDSVSLNLELNNEKTFFLILAITGLIFSLGPRLNFNGNYAHIVLPYDIILKFVPFADAIRVPTRWSFIFFLGSIYFSLITLNKLADKSNHKIFFLIIFIIFALEYIPVNIKSSADSYINNDYIFLKNVCSNEKRVLLELPLTHLHAYPNIYEGLKYITKTELSSTYHNCLLVNGYSGYDLPDNLILANTLNKYIENQETTAFLDELKRMDINYVKFNQYHFIKELKIPADRFIRDLATDNRVEKINDDLFYIK